MTEIVFRPISKPQEVFLNSTDVYLTLFGGAAGAGKSLALLGAVLPICHHPGTRVLVVRKSRQQLQGAGSLFDAAVALYSKVDPKIKISTRAGLITFSSGAVVQFSYLDKPADRFNYQGKEFSLICLDEMQQLSEENCLYLFSRLRSTIVDYPLRVLGTCNPDADSFLRKYVEFCLDGDGVPIRPADHNYPVRAFVMSPSGLIWYDSVEEAEAVHGKSKDSGIKTFKFCPANALDNVVLMETNPGYISSLKALPRVEMMRLLLGSWTAREIASGFFKREWVTEVPHPNIRAKRRVRAWDLAFSEASEVNRGNCDATAGVLMSRDEQGVLTIEDLKHMRRRVHDVERAILDTAFEDGTDTIICLPKDPGATAGAYCTNLARSLMDKGFIVKLIRPEKSKMQRFMPFASLAEAGFVHVVKADWTDTLYKELEQMDFTNNTHDDIADGCSDATFTLNKQINLPTLSYSPSTPYNTVNISGSLGTLGLNTPALPTGLPKLPF